MPFIYEEISDEDSQRANWGQYNEYQNLWKAHPDAWVVDRERNVYIWRVQGRMPEWPNEIFGLYWNGDGLGRIEVVVSLAETESKEKFFCDASFDVVKVSLPKALETDREKINKVINEAFEAFARRRGSVKKFSISFR